MTEYNQLVEYIVGISPLVLAHVVIPPISYLIGCEAISGNEGKILQQIYHCVERINPSLLKFSYIQSLMFNAQQFGVDGNHHRMLTYMFVHGDYSHLISNLLSIAQLGYPVYITVRIVSSSFVVNIILK